MDTTATITCPTCGQTVETDVDPSAGARQEYVEDCPVCCAPYLLSIQFDSRGRATVVATPE